MGLPKLDQSLNGICESCIVICTTVPIPVTFATIASIPFWHCAEGRPRIVNALGLINAGADY